MSYEMLLKLKEVNELQARMPHVSLLQSSIYESRANALKDEIIDYLMVEHGLKTESFEEVLKCA